MKVQYKENIWNTSVGHLKLPIISVPEQLIESVELSKV